MCHSLKSLTGKAEKYVLVLTNDDPLKNKIILDPSINLAPSMFIVQPFPSPSRSFQKIFYKENQAIQKQRSQDQTFSTKKERLSISKCGFIS